MNQSVESPVTGSRVLAADDNWHAAASLGVVLAMMGNEVRVAHDGIEAVELAAVFGSDITVLDIGMPQLNGHHACGRIRSRPRNNGILIVNRTGVTQDEVRRTSLHAALRL